MKRLYVVLMFLAPNLIISQTSFTSSITPDLSTYGEVTSYPGQGEYEIFLGADGILDKPIILVDGFDPSNTRNIEAIYSLLNFEGNSGTENLGDVVRAQNFDIVILNFPTYTRASDGATINGGSDFIERNAMLLVELLDIINTAKTSNSPEQNVIIGPSMGGLITRYALNYMEANTLEPDTRLFISFDAPHLGANIPIGLQHQLNFLAFNTTNPVTELQPLIDVFLKSPASRQLLINHFETHLHSGSVVDFDTNLTLPTPHPFRTIFKNNINSFTTNGFPENIRNIAIINGSGIGSPYTAADGTTPVTNGFTVVDTTLPVDVNTPLGTITLNIEIDINLTPAAGTPVQVSRFFAPLPIVPDVTSIARSGTINFDGVDAAPGGLFNISDFTDDIASGGIAEDFLNALQIDKFNFIPSVSALALDITQEASGDNINWFHNIDLASRGTTNNTPFDNTFLPNGNEAHVSLNQANVNFALNEILNNPLSITNSNQTTIQLENNLITNTLTLLSNTNTWANLKIIDLAGKIVYSEKTILKHRTAIPLNLNSGFYIISITTKNNQTITTKFLVN